MRHGFYILNELVENMSWWRRAWVVQEVILASERLIMYGHHEADWKSFMNAVEYGRLEDRFDCNVVGIPKDDAFQGLQTIRELEVRPLEGNLAGQLLRLLTLLRQRLAINPSDKVFAILGLLKGNHHELNLVPDYTACVDKIYCTVATKIIRETNSLDILSYCIDGHASGMGEIRTPSWVPDWSISETSCIPLIQTSPDASRPYKATRDSIAFAQFTSQPDVLIVEGQILDVVAEYSDLLEYPDTPDPEYKEEDDPSIGRSFVEAGYELMGAYRSLLGVVDFYDVFLTWETFSDRQPCYVYGKEDGQSAKKLFWKTLCTGQLDVVGEEQVEKLFREWRSKLSPISGLRRMYWLSGLLLDDLE